VKENQHVIAKNSRFVVKKNNQMLSCVCVFSSGGVASGTDSNGGIIGVDTNIAVFTISEKFIFSASNTLTYGQVRCDVSVKLNMVASSLLCHVFV